MAQHITASGTTAKIITPQGTAQKVDQTCWLTHAFTFHVSSRYAPHSLRPPPFAPPPPLPPLKWGVRGGQGGGGGGGGGGQKVGGFFFFFLLSLKGKSHLQRTAHTPNIAATATDVRLVNSIRHGADQKRPASSSSLFFCLFLPFFTSSFSSTTSPQSSPS